MLTTLASDPPGERVSRAMSHSLRVGIRISYDSVDYVRVGFSSCLGPRPGGRSHATPS